MRTKLTKLSIITLILFYSCISQNKLNYLYNVDNEVEKLEVKKSPTNIIKPNDELMINVSSFDDVSFNYFNDQSNNALTRGGANELSLSTISYSVNDSGYIIFPIIGEVFLSGLSLEEASSKLEKVLSPYFNQPNASIKFAFKKITILGEVNNPGYHTYSKEKLNIFEALGIAGDITVHGDRNNILLLRTQNNESTIYKIDVSQKNSISNDIYYLKADDTIIVNPRKSIKWGVVSTPVSLTLSLITTTLLVINFIQN